MNQRQALSKARKLWGKSAHIRDLGFDTCEEERNAALETRKTIPDTKETAKERDKYLFESLRYRYAVGKVVGGLFFSIKGQGDTWQQAFDAASKPLYSK